LDAKAKLVDHAVTTQSSILRSSEDNWHLRRLGTGSRTPGAGFPMSMVGDFPRSPGKTAPSTLDV